MKIYQKFINLTLFLPVRIFASVQDSFVWQCDVEQKCNLYGVASSGKKILIFSKWDKVDIGTAAFKIYKNDLGKVSYSCGSPCSYTTFINFKNGEVSDSYFLVSAIDSNNLQIALPDPSDKNDNTLEITSIFQHPQKLMKIKKDFSSGASISLTKAQFINNNLFIEYQSGANFRDHKEFIPIDYRKN